MMAWAATIRRTIVSGYTAASAVEQAELGDNELANVSADRSVMLPAPMECVNGFETTSLRNY